MSNGINFPDYKFVEFVHTSYTYRKPPTIIEVSEVSQYRKKYTPKPAWISHFRFTEDFKTYCQEKESVGEYSGSCYSGNLWFDVDVADKDNEEVIHVEALGKALELTKQLLNIIIRGYDYPSDGLRCYFTGSKGFNVGMFMEAFGLEPSRDFNDRCKYLVKKIATIEKVDGKESQSIDIDEDFYDKTRLLRIPNTPNDLSGLYKIPLTVNEILECTNIQQIITMARKPRKLELELLDPSEVAGDLAHLLDDYSAEPQKPTPGTSPGTKKGKHDYAAIWGGKLEGSSRTGSLCILAGHWQTMGMPLSEAVAMGQSWDNQNALGLDTDPQYAKQYTVGKVAGTIEDLYRRGAAGEAIEEPEGYKSLKDLQYKEHAPLRWIAEPYIPEGVTLLVGKPKLGKSWLAQNLGLAVSAGGKFLNAIDVEQGGVLYLDLDGNERRLKRRIAQILQGEDFPGNFVYEHKHDRGRMGVNRIEHWLKTSENPRLVIIDTFVKFRDLSGSKNVNLYEKDTADLHMLETLAEEHQVGILVVHHARKMITEDFMDDASGSTGLGGGSNAYMGMRKDGRSRSDATIFITGHDIEEGEGEIALDFDKPTGLWRLLGNAADYKRDTERKAIVEIIQNAAEPVGPQFIATALGKSVASIKFLLNKLLDEDMICKVGHGKYIIAQTQPNLLDTKEKK